MNSEWAQMLQRVATKGEGPMAQVTSDEVLTVVQMPSDEQPLAMVGGVDGSAVHGQGSRTGSYWAKPSGLLPHTRGSRARRPAGSYFSGCEASLFWL